jgi:hypothetical protein
LLCLAAAWFLTLDLSIPLAQRARVAVIRTWRLQTSPS